MQAYLEKNINVEYLITIASMLKRITDVSPSFFRNFFIIRNRILEAMLEGKNNAAEQLYFDEGKEAYLRDREKLEEMFSAAGFTCGLLSSYEYLDGKFTGSFFIAWAEGDK